MNADGRGFFTKDREGRKESEYDSASPSRLQKEAGFNREEHE
jgi:hypothetical protein